MADRESGDALRQRLIGLAAEAIGLSPSEQTKDELRFWIDWADVLVLLQGEIEQWKLVRAQRFFDALPSPHRRAVAADVRRLIDGWLSEGQELLAAWAHRVFGDTDGSGVAADPVDRLIAAARRVATVLRDTLEATDEEPGEAFAAAKRMAAQWDMISTAFEQTGRKPAFPRVPKDLTDALTDIEDLHRVAKIADLLDSADLTQPALAARAADCLAVLGRLRRISRAEILRRTCAGQAGEHVFIGDQITSQ